MNGTKKKWGPRCARACRFLLCKRRFVYAFVFVLSLLLLGVGNGMDRYGTDVLTVPLYAYTSGVHYAVFALTGRGLIFAIAALISGLGMVLSVERRAQDCERKDEGTRES